jgi:hypothetical protein
LRGTAGRRLNFDLVRRVGDSPHRISIPLFRQPINSEHHRDADQRHQQRAGHEDGYHRHHCAGDQRPSCFLPPAVNQVAARNRTPNHGSPQVMLIQQIHIVEKYAVIVGCRPVSLAMNLLSWACLVLVFRCEALFQAQYQPPRTHRARRHRHALPDRRHYHSGLCALARADFCGGGSVRHF